ncbi:MAG: hypothetical protein ACOC32_03555, partial [Nanoarchaeota archaeon]
CHYIDGLCGFTHFLFGEGFKGGHGCGSTITKANFEKRITYMCGACSVYDALDAGVGFLKIVGRINATDKKVKDVKLFKELLLSNGRLSPTQIQKKYSEYYGKQCEYRCFYRWSE